MLAYHYSKIKLTTIMNKRDQSYTDSIYYQIKLASRYMKLFATQLFEEVHAEISFEEFIALDVINDSKSMCQRDLAKLLLKDRANTGRIADNLKNKGYIEINVSLKGNRPIKEIVLTKKGEETVLTLKNRLKPIIKSLENDLGDTGMDELNLSLKKCINVLKKQIKNQI